MIDAVSSVFPFKPALEALDAAISGGALAGPLAHLLALTLGFSVLGYELVCAKLCGEAQVITEPYDPNPCEHCGKRHRLPTPVPVPDQPDKPEVPH